MLVIGRRICSVISTCSMFPPFKCFCGLYTLLWKLPRPSGHCNPCDSALCHKPNQSLRQRFQSMPSLHCILRYLLVTQHGIKGHAKSKLITNIIVNGFDYTIHFIVGFLNIKSERILCLSAINGIIMASLNTTEK